MKTAVEELSPTRVKLTVEVPFEELRPSLDAAYKKVAQQVRVPGFRPGKVPARIIEQRFGRAVVLEETLNDAVPKLYGQAVDESDIFPVSQPDIEVTKIEDGAWLDPDIAVGAGDLSPRMGGKGGGPGGEGGRFEKLAASELVHGIDKYF